jgi:hypothetical protein
MLAEALRGERLWMIVAGACMVVAAAALLWRWNLDVAFVAAALGVVSWFLSLRNRLKKTIVDENEIDEENTSGERDENQ